MKLASLIKTNQPKITLIGAIFVLAIVVWLFQQTGLPPEETSPTLSPELQVIKKDLPANKAPSGFLTEIPIESSGKIVQNYEAKNYDYQQATRVFQSQKTVAENYDLYYKFLTDHKWLIKNHLQTKNLATLVGSKNNWDLSVNISENSLTGIVTVSLSQVGKR